MSPRSRLCATLHLLDRRAARLLTPLALRTLRSLALAFRKCQPPARWLQALVVVCLHWYDPCRCCFDASPVLCHHRTFCLQRRSHSERRLMLGSGETQSEFTYLSGYGRPSSSNWRSLLVRACPDFIPPCLSGCLFFFACPVTALFCLLCAGHESHIPVRCHASRVHQ
jgi:hypothetical protein